MHMSWRILVALIVNCSFGWQCEIRAGGNEIIGRTIDGFSLDDAYGAKRSLADYKQARTVVVVFLGTECPLANIYAPRLDAMAKEWSEKGVQFIAINSNSQDSLTEVAAHARRQNLSFPVLKDPDNSIADQFEAERTPEVFVLDDARRIRYRGRIDDQFGIGYQKPEPTRRDLELALESILAGNEVEKPYVNPQGCLIGRVKRPDPKGDVTYSNQVARIFQKRCIECHHEGHVAPFSLESYEESVGWGEMIREVVDQRRMPPWLASPEHGEFNNNPSLSDEERTQILAWVDNGCPQGDPSEAPTKIELAKGWGMSKPDDVFYMSEKSFKVPAEGVVDYQYYVVDPGFTEDKWIKEAEVQAGTPAVVHHVIVFIGEPGKERFGNPQMAYAPGMPPRRFPKGQAIRVKAGSRLIFQVHYTPNGFEQEDRSYVGFKYADPKEVTHEVHGGAAGVMLFRIPPNDPNYRMVAVEQIKRDTVLIGMNPHMHVRGKAFRYEVEYPDGQKEILLDVPRYDFNWQLWYNLKEPKILPKGTKMICTAYFDNSAENLSNPDPTKSVTWGEQTWDEMMFGFYSTIRPRDDSPAADDSAQR